MIQRSPAGGHQKKRVSGKRRQQMRRKLTHLQKELYRLPDPKLAAKDKTVSPEGLEEILDTKQRLSQEIQELLDQLMVR